MINMRIKRKKTREDTAGKSHWIIFCRYCNLLSRGQHDKSYRVARKSMYVLAFLLLFTNAISYAVPLNDTGMTTFADANSKIIAVNSSVVNPGQIIMAIGTELKSGARGLVCSRELYIKGRVDVLNYAQGVNVVNGCT